MYALQRWSKDKPFAVCILAYLSAPLIDTLPDYFLSSFRGKIYGQNIPLHPLKDWLRLYRQHRRVNGWLIDLAQSDFFEFSPDHVGFVENISEASRLLNFKSFESIKKECLALPPDILGSYMDNAIKQRDDILNTLESAYVTEVGGAAVSPELIALFSEEFSGRIDTAFFLQVWSPCWLLYRQLPSRLYRRARLGDRSALDKLLRLDPSILHDPTIGKVLLRLRRSRPSAYADLLSSATKKPKVKLTRQKIKVNLAGLFSMFSQLAKAPLTEPEIRAFFDAVAKDLHKQNCDPDLPSAPEALYKAIQRERADWAALLRSDKRK